MILLHVFRKSFLPNGKGFLLSSSKHFRVIQPASLAPRWPVFQKDAELALCYVRRYSANQNIPNFDPKQQQRRRALTILTYLSGFIGACLLTAVGAREYQKLKMRARGIEPLKNRLYGRRPILFHYRGYYVPQFVVNVIDNVHRFKVREDDIWIISFPKAGTTWLQEVIFLINNNVDFESAKSTIEDRIPYFEYIYPGIPAVDNMPSPRCIKTHLPFSLLPNDFNVKKPKAIYIARNSKDTVVSLYNFQRKFLKPVSKLNASFDEYCQLFLNDEVIYGPWWKHVKEAWERRNDDNVLFITYEDMKEDLPGSIKKISEFLGKTLSSQEVQAIASHCSFDEMKTNKFVNYTWFQEKGIAAKDASFMRKGQVGDWMNHLSKEVVAKFDEMVATKVEPTGLTFRDSLENDEA